MSIDDDDRFSRWWIFALRWEGSYSNDPDDPGRETKWGISRRAHPEISDEEWRNFTLVAAKTIAYTDYWLVCDCNNLRSPVCYYVADTAFNLGTGAATHLRFNAETPDDILFARIALYTKMQHAPKYLKGWVNRVLDLRRTFGR